MNPMRRRILVPLDGSEGSEAVLSRAAALAEAEGAAVELLHVAPPVRAVVVDGRVLAFADDVARRVSHQVLRYLLSAAAALPGLDVRTRVRFGDPVEEIVAEAEAPDVDLVAMATHRRWTVGRLLHRSVARRVRRGTARPVLLVEHERPGEGVSAAPPPRVQRFWCPDAGQDVEAEIEEHGLPGFRSATGVRRCSAFDPPATVGCARRCLDPTFRLPWAAVAPVPVKPAAE